MIKIENLTSAAAPPQSPPKAEARDEKMVQRAKEFESVFVAQMLKHSGFEKALSTDSGFGGQNFASLLLDQYSTKIVENGGFGLADKIYEQLKIQDGGNAD